MWMPRKLRERRARLSEIRADANQRLDAAHAAQAQAEHAARRSAPVAARSAELIDANSIAAAIAASLRAPPRTGGNNHAP